MIYLFTFIFLSSFLLFFAEVKNPCFHHSVDVPFLPKEGVIPW